MKKEIKKETANSVEDENQIIEKYELIPERIPPDISENYMSAIDSYIKRFPTPLDAQKYFTEDEKGIYYYKERQEYFKRVEEYNRAKAKNTAKFKR